MTLKHRWEIRFNSATGYTFQQWWRLLRLNQFDLDGVYAHRVAFVTVMSLINSLYHAFEQTRFSGRIRETELPQSPIFILGHWRSGTTHLHNLLALNTDQFSAINTYQTAHPFTFLVSKPFYTRLMAFALPETRVVDTMPLQFHSPQEDELALAMLSLKSPYLGAHFPRHREAYLRYLDFVDVPEAEIAQWKAAFIYLIKKLTSVYPGQTLILKSPPHTARIKHLLDLFPEARFIHIHRHPYTVFQSTRRLYDTIPWFNYLQKPDLATIDEFLLYQYQRLHEAYFAQRPLIAPNHFYEIPFHELEADPISAIRGIYEAFELGDFDTFYPTLNRYVAGLADYRKNVHVDLPQPLRQRLVDMNPRCFQVWGYET